MINTMPPTGYPLPQAILSMSGDLQVLSSLRRTRGHFRISVQIHPSFISDWIPRDPPPRTRIVIPMRAQDQPCFGVRVVAPLRAVPEYIAASRALQAPHARYASVELTVPADTRR